MARDFLRSLHQWNVSGDLRIPPSLHLNLVSKNAVKRALDTRLTYDRAGRLSTIVLRSIVSSAFESLGDDREDREVDLRRVRSATEGLRQYLDDTK